MPEALQNRQVEITGPPLKKHIINALNSGAQSFMADMEESLSPTWHNVLSAHQALKLAFTKRINFYDDEARRMYKLKRACPFSSLFL